MQLDVWECMQEPPKEAPVPKAQVSISDPRRAYSMVENEDQKGEDKEPPKDRNRRLQLSIKLGGPCKAGLEA